MRIAIIGMGFVGGTIYKSFETFHNEVTLTAIDPAKGFDNSYDSIKNHDAVFVCVPSPESEDSTVDSKPLRQVLRDLKAVGFSGPIISKVTATPDVYKKLEKMYPNLIHAPEFLTAANAYSDYVSGKFAIIGGKDHKLLREAESIIRMSQPMLVSTMHCSIAEASFAKYLINSFLATKVVFMNEMAALARTNNLDWSNIVSAAIQDSRIGSSHMQVPGPDGKFGFGGMCFPKDTVAIAKYAEQCNVNIDVLNAAVMKNNSIRLTNTD